MTTVAEIEQAINRLPPEEFRALREWFAQHDAQLWDRQFESDAQSGRLDAPAAEALNELDRGQCKDL